MTVKNIIDLLDVRNCQAKAYCEVYSKYLEYSDLQKAVNGYALNLANSLMKQCEAQIKNESFRKELKQNLLNIGANKNYNGKRVHKAFYELLINYEQNLSNAENNGSNKNDDELVK